MSPSQRIDVNALTQQDQQPQVQIASILEPAINADPAPTQLTVESAAGAIDELYTSTYNTNEQAEDLFWNLWTLYISVAKQVPADDPRQQFLVTLASRLQSRQSGSVEIWGDNVSVWGDLSMLSPCMRDAWNFTPKFDNSEKDNADIKSWTSLNSFAARLYGSSITSWDNFGIWALREALEQEPENDTARDAHLGVVYEWIVHAGKTLYEKGSKPQDLDQAGQRMLKPGKLFEGESGVTDKRWQFWRERIETLGKQVGDEELKKKVDKAVEVMNSVGA